jgi:hypothetical protein
MAEQLRVFVITWDPLEQLVARPDGFATVNADPSGLELVVYLPIWSVLGLAGGQGRHGHGRGGRDGRLGGGDRRGAQAGRPRGRPGRPRAGV